MPGDLLLLELHPPVAHSWWWWLVVAGLVVAALGLGSVGIWRWRMLSRPHEETIDDSLTQLRDAALRRIDRIRTSDAPATERARLIGRVAREFVGTVGDGDADYQSAAQLRVEALKDPRLEPVATLAARVDAHAFGGADDAAVDELARAAKEVIQGWR